MKIKRELAQNQNRYLLLIALLILFSGFTLKNRCKKSSIKIYAIDWYAYTRNRITKKTITETNNIFVSKICSTDSLNILLSSLVPTKDTTYNLRMYCLISQNKKKYKLYFDKSGIVEYNGNFYSKNENLMRYILNFIPFDCRKSYTPEWVTFKN